MLLGVTNVVILALLYASPLSSMAIVIVLALIRQVIKNKDASSINLNLAVAATLNSVLWSVYGTGQDMHNNRFSSRRHIYLWTQPSGHFCVLRANSFDCYVQVSPNRSFGDEWIR